MLAAVNLADRLSVDVQGAQSLRAKAAAGDPEALRAAAKQFEAMVVQMMLKTMRQTKFTAEGDPFGDSSTLRAYQEMLDQQWAQKMVAAGGLGFADAIVKRLDVENEGKVIQDRLAREALGDEAAPTGHPLEQAPQAHPESAPKAAPPAYRFETPSAGDHKSQFISAMLPYARQAEAATGVPARFIIGHAALESGWGKHEIATADGRTSHNLFGIKATGWSGEAAETTTTEYRGGLAMKVSQKFRAYGDYAEGFTDYAKLLQRRYPAAASAGDDAAAFAAGLSRGGYATDPDYAGKLTRTIASVTAGMDQA